MTLRNQTEFNIALELLSKDAAAFVVYSISEHKENYKRIQSIMQKLCLTEDDTTIQTKMKKIVTHLGNIITSDWSGEHYYEKERAEIQKAFNLFRDIYLMVGHENYMKAGTE